ncbi:hypothetical protein CDD82_6894 [Ophiocordyceps australis]|uniref:DnaJ-related protein SCJ1 n=1 Tax=Ophiocordyceps australis TaxID=1399860 RepID=A0A2C5ZQ58_9HYPO|nr:hypothetical protein CDD82_6894 [Ophiocordyceps australis]
MALQVLQVDKTATDKQLKSAYRKLSKKYHPDKNQGDESAHEKFVQVSEAYDVLSNQETRQIYDRYGHEGIKSHRQGGQGQGNHDPFDLFSRFFGGHGHFGHSSHEPRGHNVEVRVQVSLRDFYTGATTEFRWDKQVICETCQGSGSADGHVDTCPHCAGRGIRIVKQQLAPGMFQQMQMRCDACAGRGKTIKHKCPACDGARVVRTSTTVSLDIARGAPRDSRVVYENEADQSPDYVAGDLIVTLTEKPPEAEGNNPKKVDGIYFRRQGDDLYWTEILSLREAWMGDWQRNLTHLDGHLVRLSRPRGKVVQPGHVDTIADQGMPRWNEEEDDNLGYGKLYVTYEVVLPDQMDTKITNQFWDLWEKWRKTNGVSLHEDSGRPDPPERDEL